MADVDRAALARRARTVVLLLLALLLACVGSLIVSQRHVGSNPVAAMLFLLLPLLLPAHGLWRGDRRTYAWATLCLTPVFVYALTEIVANPSARAVSIALLLGSFALLAALIAFLRLTRPQADRGREQ
jgi:uncharacterized membrane protein